MPSAPSNFRLLATSTPTTANLEWAEPDPLNGQLAFYELQYGREETFPEGVTSAFVLFTQFTVQGLQGGVVYLLRVRASTASLMGLPLWGPYATIRVQDGVYTVKLSLWSRHLLV